MASVEQRPAALRALVVDDEALARRNLNVLLQRDPDIAQVEECESGMQAIEAIRKSKHDLVFLDVQMPECGGFDVLEILGSDLPPAIIFVTAYEEYALRAFEAGALDYLLKPFDDARFARALSRAKEKIGHYSSHRPQRAERLVVKSRGQVLFLNVAEIDWIEAAGYYACLHVGEATHILRRTLSDLEHDLGEESFTRIHRSIIVNVERIRALELQESGDYEVVLTTQARLRLSRRFRRALQDKLGLLSGPDGEVVTDS
jgi:two-component system, LytTR family, response regulator